MNSEFRVIAIHLPQFHPTPENDKWWGKGFTEWTNVTKAKPLFKGHYQPRLPADLGFYDLRLEESRIAQADLARQYGIYGFCYYHYWFNGKRLLKRPIDDMLINKTPDFPFMFFWANETWSRRWLGEERKILIKQTYSEKDDIQHANWLCENAFCDNRYIKIFNRPAFIIYKSHDLPNYKQTIEVLKSTAIKQGLKEPYIIGSNSHRQDLNGFDQVLNFEPQLGLLPNAFKNGISVDASTGEKRMQNLQLGIRSSKLKIYDYKEVKEIMGNKSLPYSYLPSVFVGWDNSARRGKNGIIIINQNKEDFKKSLEMAKNVVSENKTGEKIVFINAWNEWAEGNHLEPCSQYGHQFLEAVKEVFANE